jgi:hypothetical protein
VLGGGVGAAAEGVGESASSPPPPQALKKNNSDKALIRPVVVMSILRTLATEWPGTCIEA